MPETGRVLTPLPGGGACAPDRTLPLLSVPTTFSPRPELGEPCGNPELFATDTDQAAQAAEASSGP